MHGHPQEREVALPGSAAAAAVAVAVAAGATGARAPRRPVSAAAASSRPVSANGVGVSLAASGANTARRAGAPPRSARARAHGGGGGGFVSRSELGPMFTHRSNRVGGLTTDAPCCSRMCLGITGVRVMIAVFWIGVAVFGFAWLSNIPTVRYPIVGVGAFVMVASIVLLIVFRVVGREAWRKVPPPTTAGAAGLPQDAVGAANGVAGAQFGPSHMDGVVPASQPAQQAPAAPGWVQPGVGVSAPTVSSNAELTSDESELYDDASRPGTARHEARLHELAGQRRREARMAAARSAPIDSGNV